MSKIRAIYVERDESRRTLADSSVDSAIVLIIKLDSGRSKHKLQ